MLLLLEAKKEIDLRMKVQAGERRLGGDGGRKLDGEKRGKRDGNSHRRRGGDRDSKCDGYKKAKRARSEEGGRDRALKEDVDVDRGRQAFVRRKK